MNSTLSYKIVSIDKLQERLKHWRALGDTVVFTNGCFDILHVGHVTVLAHCRELGQHVVVGLNSDASVKKLKGESRPINQQANRALVLAALESVDAVVVFEEETPLKLIEEVKPNVLVKGGDYQQHQIVGADFVNANRGKVVMVPFIEGESTTDILERLQN